MILIQTVHPTIRAHQIPTEIAIHQVIHQATPMENHQLNQAQVHQTQMS